MKKYVTLSLFIFWTITVAILVAGLVNYDNNKTASTKTGASNQVGKITGVETGVTSLKLSAIELAKHNSYQSCWLLISGKIYDVTTYLNSHPGGEAEILKTCGTDATVIYDNRDNTGSHSAEARAMLSGYYIGDFNQTVKTSLTNPTAPAIANPTAATTQNRTRNDDDD